MVFLNPDSNKTHRPDLVASTDLSHPRQAALSVTTIHGHAASKINSNGKRMRVKNRLQKFPSPRKCSPVVYTFIAQWGLNEVSNKRQNSMSWLAISCEGWIARQCAANRDASTWSVEVYLCTCTCARLHNMQWWHHSLTLDSNKTQ